MKEKTKIKKELPFQERPLLVDRTHQPEYFFTILPDDWREDIEPEWPAYKNWASIYTLEIPNSLAVKPIFEIGSDGKPKSTPASKLVYGGGIIFSIPSPDTLIYKREAQHWFDKGYLYMAWIWIQEEFRGHSLGSIWVEEVIKHHPGQKFWLTIEDYSLWEFYKKCGFQMVKRLKVGETGEEWVLVYE